MKGAKAHSVAHQSPAKGLVHDNKENVELNNYTTTLGTESASPGKQTTVILSEKKEQLKAAHEAKNEQVTTIPQSKPYGGYNSPVKTAKIIPSSPMLESPKWGGDQDFLNGNFDDVLSDVTKSGQKHAAGVGKPIPRSPLFSDFPVRPTSTVPTLNSLLGDVSPYKPQVTLQCLEDIPGTTRDRKRKLSKTRDSIGGIDASVDMSITQTYGDIIDTDDALNESQEAATATNILASFGKNSEESAENRTNDPRYNSFVDNFVVDYDSDISITIPKSSKIPGFNRLYEEDDMSMTNININPNNTSANDSQISNSSELDMSMTKTFKFPTPSATNRADVTNHFISDMSMVSQGGAHNRSNTSMDNSADMSFTRPDLGKLVGQANNDSMDMSVTNMRFPTPTKDNSELDMSITRQRINPEYNTTVSNFVVNYDDDVSITMNVPLKKQATSTVEEDEEEVVADEQTSKFKATVDNFVISYDDDSFNGKPNLNESADNGEMSITMNRADFNKLLESEASMTMTRDDFGKILGVNTSVNASMNASFQKDTLNTSAKKLATQDLLTSSPLPQGRLMSKLMTPNKTPSQEPTKSFPINSSFSQSLPILPSHQTTKVSPSENLSNVSMDDMLHESVRKDASVDEDQFSFSRFLQLANIPSFNPSRASIIGAIPRVSEEEPSPTDTLESAFITRHDVSDMQTACEQFRTLAVEKKQAAERLEKLLGSSLAPPNLYAALRSSDPAEVTKAEKQAKKLRNFCKVQAKIEFIERRQQMEQRSLAIKRHGLELLRQDAARLATMVKSLQTLTDELPSDIKTLEQTKRLQIAQQINVQTQPAAQTQVKYTMSTAAQTEPRALPQTSKRSRSERTAELQHQMNEDFDSLKFMQQSQHWIPRIFTQKEILLHWDFYKIHVIFNPKNTDEVSSASLSLINPSQRLNDFHVSMMRSARITPLLQSLKNSRDVVPVLREVFQRFHRVRFVLDTVKRLSAIYHVKTDTKFIRHTPTNEDCGVIEIQFSDHRATTKFGVVFELTCAYPYSELAAFPRKPLFGNVTTVGIAAALETIEPGYERMERACAALQELAIEGKEKQ